MLSDTTMDGTPNSVVNDTSCICTATGLPPTTPRAPRIAELLEDINQQLDDLRIQEDPLKGGLGLFQNISRLKDLRQLDSTTNSINGDDATQISRTKNVPPVSKSAFRDGGTNREDSNTPKVATAPADSGAATRDRPSGYMMLVFIGFCLVVWI